MQLLNKVQSDFYCNNFRGDYKLILQIENLISPVSCSITIMHVPIPVRFYEAINEILYIELSITRISY
jgi:hypothetical protein